MTLEYIDKAREALKLKKYEPGKFGAERVLMDMAARREIERVANRTCRYKKAEAKVEAEKKLNLNLNLNLIFVWRVDESRRTKRRRKIGNVKDILTETQKKRGVLIMHSRAFKKNTIISLRIY